jgi:hypothetical protein
MVAVRLMTQIRRGIAMFVPSERTAGPEFRPLRDGASLPGWEAYVSKPRLRQPVPGNPNVMGLGENAAALGRRLRAVIEQTLVTAHVPEPPSPRAAHPISRSQWMRAGWFDDDTSPSVQLSAAVSPRGSRQALYDEG